MLKQLLSLARSMGKKLELSSIPMPDNIEEKLDIEYLSQDGLPLHLDIFKPKNIKNKIPVAIVVHGGGFAYGDQTMERPFSRLLAAKGILVYAIDYRIVDECLVFEPIKDILSGFAYVYNHLEQDSGDCKQIYLIAESAGAYASLYAQAFNKNDIFKKWIDYQTVDIAIKGNVFVSGLFYTNKIDYIGFFYKKNLFGELRKDSELMRLMNPECKEVLSILPQSAFITSDYDFLENYTLRYQKAFSISNPNNLLLTFSGNKDLCHAFATLCPYLKESKQAMNEVIAYFKENNK